MKIPSPFAGPMSPSQLLACYAAGQRDFQRARLDEAHLARAVLSGADLREADLLGANLVGADLRESMLQMAWLSGANLTRANLEGAKLKWSFLVRANLSRANLNQSSLVETMLSGANLSRASLLEATLDGVSFEDVDATEIRLGSTRFVNVRLGPLCSSPCVHVDASSIDLHTLVRSRNDPGLAGFLRRTGLASSLSARLVMIAQNLGPRALTQSTQQVFLVHHRADTPAAVWLHDRLEANGLTSYLKRWTPPTLHACRVHRVVLLCSRTALRARSALSALPGPRSDGTVPPFMLVALDEYVHTAASIPVSGCWMFDKHALCETLRSRVVADLSGAQSTEEYTAEVDKLVAVLRAPMCEAESA